MILNKKIALLIAVFFIQSLLGRCIKENKSDETEQDWVVSYIVNNIKMIQSWEIKIKNKV